MMKVLELCNANVPLGQVWGPAQQRVKKLPEKVICQQKAPPPPHPLTMPPIQVYGPQTQFNIGTVYILSI